jgi:16S rRNA G527 N7-methylase RsmG
MPDAVRRVVDVGGGVGLPSIPLALLFPDIEFTLVDRSQRRTDLARRAVKILGIDNYEVLALDIAMVDPVFDVALFRASLPIPRAAAALSTCVTPTGTGLLAVSRQIDRPVIPKPPDGITFALSHEGDGILVSPFWLLEMLKR